MRTRSSRGCGHRSVPDRRNHRQGLLARSCGLVRQRVAAGDEPGVSVPDELRPGQWRSETGHRATLRLHRADDLHLQAQAEPQVRQRTRADVLGRQVLHRQGEQDQRPQRTAVAAGQPRQRRDAGSVDGGLQAEAAQRPDLPPGARHQRRTDHRRRGVPARQGARRRRHRRRRAVRGSLHDDDLLQESAHRPARQPRLSGAVRQAQDGTGRHQVLRQHRQPQDRHREPGHRRRGAQPVAHRHRGTPEKPQPRRSRGSRRGTALHRLQHEHHARRHPRAEAGDPQGDRLVTRPRRAGP